MYFIIYTFYEEGVNWILLNSTFQFQLPPFSHPPTPLTSGKQLNIHKKTERAEYQPSTFSFIFNIQVTGSTNLASSIFEHAVGLV